MDFSVLFLTTSLSFALPPGLLNAVCFTESGHNPLAYHAHDGGNGTPSFGLCQIKEKTARQMGFRGKTKDLMKPEVNIYYAGKYLRYQFDRYNDWTRAVCAYNKGRSDSHGGNAYLARVFNSYVNERRTKPFQKNLQYRH